MLNNYLHYLQIILSSAAVYLFIVIAIRLFGKKELSQLSIADLVFILLISNAVQNAMVLGDNTLPGGLVAAITLFVVNFLFKFILYKFPRIGRLVQGEALILIYKGKLHKANLRKAKLTIDEMNEAIREHGVGTIAEVDLAVLEIDGNISILSNEFKQRTMKKRKARKFMTNVGQE